MAGRLAFALSNPFAKGSAMKLPALPAIMIGLCLGLAGPASAATEPNPMLSAEPGGQDFGDGELNHFVAAFVRMIGVQHGYMMMLQNEADPAKAEQLKASAITAMEDAIRKDGLSVDRYNQIALAVRDDPQLQGRVEGILQQLSTDPDAPAEDRQQ